MIEIEKNIWIKHNSKEVDLKVLFNCFKKAEEFYDIKDYSETRIFLVNKKEDLGFLMNKKKEEMSVWMMGRCLPEINMIVAYSPEGIEENTNRQKFVFRGILTYELAHIFYHTRKYKKNLHLLNEGISSYIQNILINKMDLTGKQDIDIDNPEDTDIFQSFSKEIYRRGIFLIKRIVDNLGKDVLFEFLEKTKNLESDDEIRELFKDIILKNLQGDKIQ